MERHLANLEPVLRAMDAGHLVLTPNHRTGVQLLECYGQWRQVAHLTPVCPTPQAWPVDIWIRRQWTDLGPDARDTDMAILEPVQETMLWQSIIRDSDFGAGLVNQKATARAVQQAWRLAHLWKISRRDIGRLIQFQQQAEHQDDLGAFLAWVGSFEAFCARHALLSLSALVEKVTAAIPGLAHTLPPAVLFYGFQNPPPLYRDLITQLESVCPASAHLAPPPLAPATRVMPCPDADAEIAQATAWAREVLAAHPDARIGIICPELQQRAPALLRLFNDSFHPGQATTLCREQPPLFSIPQRLPLADTPLVHAALAILALNETWVDTLAFCRLLRSPFLPDGDDGDGARTNLEKELRQSGELKTRVAWIRELAGNSGAPFASAPLAAALMELANLRRQAAGTMNAGQWCELFERQLACLGWPGERPATAAERRQFRHWSQTLKLFKQSGHWYGPLTFSQALGRLGQLLASMEYTAGNDQAPIQVLGPTEADGLVFTHTWVLGLTEQHWPPTVRPSPFIPLTLQQQAGVPGSDIRALTAAAQEQLQGFRDHTSDEMVFSYPCQQDDMPMKPTGMLKHITGVAPEQPQAQAMAPTEPTAAPARHPAVLAMGGKDATEGFSDSLTVPLLPEEGIRGGTSLLADQADCPFRAFARHRLRIDSLPAPAIGLPGNVLGSLLHDTLERFWQQVSGQQALLALAPEALDALVSDAVDKAIASTARFHPHTMSLRFIELESQRLKALLAGWLDEEKSRGAFTVLSREQRLQWQLAGLSLRLRIDRVDETDNGNLVIVDYKSSKGAEIKWTDPRQTEPQLMLYLMAVEAELARPVDGIFIAQVNVEDCRYKGISNDNAIYPKSLFSDKRQMPAETDWATLKHDWQHSLTALANEFLGGYVAVDPKAVTSSCTWCDLGGFCRIAEEVQS